MRKCITFLRLLWHTEPETATSVMIDGLHIKDIKVTPKEIHSKWHLCISEGEWLHIIDFRCGSGEIWHAADSSAQIVKFYTPQNLRWRTTDNSKRTLCVLNSHSTFYFTGSPCISRNGHENKKCFSTSFYAKPHTTVTWVCNISKKLHWRSDTFRHVCTSTLLLL